jgi:hypothetical protein
MKFLYHDVSLPGQDDEIGSDGWHRRLSRRYLRDRANDVGRVLFGSLDVHQVLAALLQLTQQHRFPGTRHSDAQNHFFICFLIYFIFYICFCFLIWDDFDSLLLGQVDID